MRSEPPCCLIGGDRQGQDHGQSSAGGVLGCERAVHGFGESPGQGEAEAESGGVVAVAEALERFEGALAVVGGDPGAPVGDPDVDPPGQGAGCH